jgi:deoxyribose-phosphate aldolase
MDPHPPMTTAERHDTLARERAICIHPSLITEAKDALQGSTVKVASVATG